MRSDYTVIRIPAVYCGLCNSNHCITLKNPISRSSFSGELDRTNVRDPRRVHSTVYSQCDERVVRIENQRHRIPEFWNHGLSNVLSIYSFMQPACDLFRGYRHMEVFALHISFVQFEECAVDRFKCGQKTVHALGALLNSFLARSPQKAKEKCLRFHFVSFINYIAIGIFTIVFHSMLFLNRQTQPRPLAIKSAFLSVRSAMLTTGSG